MNKIDVQTAAVLGRAYESVFQPSAPIDNRSQRFDTALPSTVGREPITYLPEVLDYFAHNSALWRGSDNQSSLIMIEMLRRLGPSRVPQHLIERYSADGDFHLYQAVIALAGAEWAKRHPEATGEVITATSVVDSVSKIHHAIKTLNNQALVAQLLGIATAALIPPPDSLRKPLDPGLTAMLQNRITQVSVDLDCPLGTALGPHSTLKITLPRRP